MIPGGSFIMGKEDTVFKDTAPAHQVLLSDFRLSQHEVTVMEFLEFAQSLELEFAYSKLLEDDLRSNPCRPVRGISWYLAQSYCQSRGGRLPTEAEWEYAATVSPQANYRKSLWPSGSEFPVLYEEAMLDAVEPEEDETNSGEGLEDKESEVESTPAPRSMFLQRELVEIHDTFLGLNGLHGMMGSVWEWVLDWYGPYSATLQDNPQGLAKGFWKVLRGGSHRNVDQPALLDPTLRNQARPEQFFAHVGFRCAWPTL